MESLVSQLFQHTQEFVLNVILIFLYMRSVTQYKEHNSDKRPGHFPFIRINEIIKHYMVCKFEVEVSLCCILV